MAVASVEFTNVGKASAADASSPLRKRRRSGIPTGNAGEYFVMGELLRRGFDAQLADRNTADYDVLVGQPTKPTLTKVQVKTVRAAPWYVRASHFEGEMAARITIYVLLGAEKADQPVRYFITRNADVAAHLHRPGDWPTNGFMPKKAVEPFKDRWDLLATL